MQYLLLYLFQKSKYSILGLMLFGKRRDKNMKRKNLALTMLLINLFIAFLGIGLVIPVLPTIMNELNLSGSVVGNLVAAFAFVQLLVSPFSGRWADKYGRKKMIIIGLILFSLSELLFGIAKTVGTLFISRLAFLEELALHSSCQQ